MKAIVVLGSRIPGNEIHEELRMRLDVSVKLFEKDSIFILSGGYTNHEHKKSEAQFMADYIIGLGIPQESIYLDEEALDTIGNGYFVRKVVDRITGITDLAVVSSCYHMKRSQYIFKRCFGDMFPMDVSHCAAFHRKTIDEDSSTQMARDFFSGIEDGDIGSIGVRLYSDHLMYNGQGNQ